MCSGRGLPLVFNLNARVRWSILPAGQAQWTEELARFLLVWVAMFGSALAFSKRAHIGIDWLIGKFHPDTRTTMALVAQLIVIAFAGVVLLYGRWKLTSSAFASGQITPALGIPRGFVYLAVPLSGCFILIQSVGDLLSRRLHSASSPPPSSPIFDVGFLGYCSPCAPSPRRSPWPAFGGDRSHGPPTTPMATRLSTTWAVCHSFHSVFDLLSPGPGPGASPPTARPPPPR